MRRLKGPFYLEPKLVTFEEVKTDPCGWNSSAPLSYENVHLQATAYAGQTLAVARLGDPRALAA